jgi:hypothetical protein
MFDRLSILVNGVTRVPQSLQSVSTLAKNYAKTIRSHSTAAPLSAKDGRIPELFGMISAANSVAS